MIVIMSLQESDEYFLLPPHTCCSTIIIREWSRVSTAIINTWTPSAPACIILGNNHRHQQWFIGNIQALLQSQCNVKNRGWNQFPVWSLPHNTRSETFLTRREAQATRPGLALVRRLKICWWNWRRKDTFSFFVVSLNRLNHRVGNNWALFLGFCIVQFVNSDECSHLACIIWTQHLWSHSPSSPVNATSATNSLVTLHTTLDTPDKENRICKYWKSTKNVEYWL